MGKHVFRLVVALCLSVVIGGSVVAVQAADLSYPGDCSSKKLRKAASKNGCTVKSGGDHLKVFKDDVMITTIPHSVNAEQYMPLDHQDSEQDVLSNSLFLWTIQEEDVLQSLEKNGVLHADPTRVDPGMLPAYEWMAARLAERVPAPPGCRLPLWAWLRWDGRDRPQPDLRAAGHLPKGRRGVRIAFEIPADQALVSDFDAWHAVLNGVPFVPEDADYDTIMDHFDHLEGSARRAFLEKSWRGIFPVPPWPHDMSLQAVFWELHKDQILEITPFRAR